VKAIDLLKKQHREIEKLFGEVLKSEDPRVRMSVASEIHAMLEVHMTIEEETFYPAYRRAAKDTNADSLVLEAVEEHHVLDLLLEELPKINASGENFGARMKVLEELIAHHVEEEEIQMFPDAERRMGSRTLDRLGAEMEVRAAQLAISIP